MAIIERYSGKAGFLKQILGVTTQDEEDHLESKIYREYKVKSDLGWDSLLSCSISYPQEGILICQIKIKFLFYSSVEFWFAKGFEKYNINNIRIFLFIFLE